MEKKESAKERILRAAEELFYQEGIRAVGIDRIIAESGVAKASFYRNFATKDDLIVSFIEHYHKRVMNRIEEALELYPGQPLEQLKHIFRKLVDRMNDPDFRGCPFMNTTVEFPERTHPGHLASTESRRVVWGHIGNMIKALGAKDPEALTAQLEQLYSGAAMLAYMYRAPIQADQFYNAALVLIREQVGDKVTQ